MAVSRLHNLRLRSELLRAVREEFYAAEFCEVSTPVRIPAPAPEEFIESVPCAGGFLRTSPELAMKRMLCAGMERMFQIGPAFRAGESGRKHREEFTILEYYAGSWDYRRLAEFTAQLLAGAVRRVRGGTALTYRGRPVEFAEHRFITVDEAFRKYAGVSAFAADAARGDIRRFIGKTCGKLLRPAETRSSVRVSIGKTGTDHRKKHCKT